MKKAVVKKVTTGKTPAWKNMIVTASVMVIMVLFVLTIVLMIHSFGKTKTIIANNIQDQSIVGTIQAGNARIPIYGSGGTYGIDPRTGVIETHHLTINPGNTRMFDIPLGSKFSYVFSEPGKLVHIKYYGGDAVRKFVSPDGEVTWKNEFDSRGDDTGDHNLENFRGSLRGYIFTNKDSQPLSVDVIVHW